MFPMTDSMHGFYVISPGTLDLKAINSNPYTYAPQEQAKLNIAFSGLITAMWLLKLCLTLHALQKAYLVDLLLPKAFLCAPINELELFLAALFDIVNCEINKLLVFKRILFKKKKISV